MDIKLKRVHEKASKGDGTRILVDRLWPRGIKKSDLKLDAWLKEVAPSTELRVWFSHDPSKWSQFQKKYTKELEAHQEALELLVHALRDGAVTLLFSSHDTEHNNAVVLRDYLKSHFASKLK